MASCSGLMCGSLIMDRWFSLYCTISVKLMGEHSGRHIASLGIYPQFVASEDSHLHLLLPEIMISPMECGQSRLS